MTLDQNEESGGAGARDKQRESENQQYGGRLDSTGNHDWWEILNGAFV